MRIVSTKAMALALAAGVIATVAAPPALAKKETPADSSKPDYSPDVRKAAVAAQDALKKKDNAAALAAINQAKAAAKTPDDQYLASALLFDLARSTGDQAQISQAIDGMIASGKAPPAQLPQLLTAQGQFAYEAKDYKKAQASLDQAVQGGNAKPETYIMLAEVKHQNGDVQGALQAAQQAVDAEKAAGQAVPEDWLKRARAIAYEAKLMPQTLKWSEQLVAAYPSPENWRSTLILYRDSSNLDDQTNLDLMRLMSAAHALSGERDYYEYANLAFNRGFPGEAAAVIQQGTADNMIPAGSKAISEVKGLAQSKIAADKAALPGLEKKARAAADGKLALSTGDDYLGYGQYAQAADLYRLALTKGGVDPNVVNMRIGEALARSGDKAGALAAFAKVTGPRQTLAQFWTLWTNQKAGGGQPQAATQQPS